MFAFKRLVRIYRVCTRYQLDMWLLQAYNPWWLRVLVYVHPSRWGRNKLKYTAGEALRLAFQDLGPIFIKLGQALSTRPDILPFDIASQLALLQDKVPPFDGNIAIRVITDAFRKPIHEVFASFDKDALASASIAQVHSARLHSGEDVVVKVLRPHVQEHIKTDIHLMYFITKLIQPYMQKASAVQVDLNAIVAEFEKHLLQELNLQREGANASQLRRNFKDSKQLYVPRVLWDYTTQDILVTERIYGIPISDITALKAHNVNIPLLAKYGVEIFFTQVFRDCFFHADMHPGNIFVSLENPAIPQYICVDFGIMGTLNNSDKRYLAENLYAFFNQDYRRVAELHVESGWVPYDTNIEDFESAIRTVCEPILEKPLQDISLGYVVFCLFHVAKEFRMVIQPQLMLLQKTLLAVEGLGRQLYPELDLWMTAKPFLERWLKEQIGPKALWNQLRDNMPFFTEQLPHMPKRIYNVLRLVEEEKKYQYMERTKITTSASFKMLTGISIGFICGILITILLH